MVVVWEEMETIAEKVKASIERVRATLEKVNKKAKLNADTLDTNREKSLTQSRNQSARARTKQKVSLPSFLLFTNTPLSYSYTNISIPFLINLGCP